MDQIVRVVKNIKKLEQAYQKETLRGSSIKETHVSQSPLDQSYFIAIRDGVEIHFMVGKPLIREKKPDKKYFRQKSK
jgi:hypothetical protein